MTVSRITRPFVAGDPSVVAPDVPLEEATGSADWLISVVIPARNEAHNIGWVLERVPPFVDEVVLVDGNSTDRTVEVARILRPDIVVVGQDRPGKGAAVRAGFAAARGDIIVMLDADGSMDPAEMGRFIHLLSVGYDLVKGSRFLPGGGTTDISLLRRVGNGGLLRFGNVLYGTRFSELCYGYMAFKRQPIQSLGLSADGFEIETEIVTRALGAGLRIAEAASFEAPRRYGTSNLHTFRDGWRVFRTLVRERPARWPVASWSEAELTAEVQPELSYVGLEPELSYVGLEPELSYVGLEPELSYVGLEPELSYVGLEPELALSDRTTERDFWSMPDSTTVLSSASDLSLD